MKPARQYGELSGLGYLCPVEVMLSVKNDEVAAYLPQRLNGLCLLHREAGKPPPPFRLPVRGWALNGVLLSGINSPNLAERTPMERTTFQERCQIGLNYGSITRPTLPFRPSPSSLARHLEKPGSRTQGRSLRQEVARVARCPQRRSDPRSISPCCSSGHPPLSSPRSTPSTAAHLSSCLLLRSPRCRNSLTRPAHPQRRSPSPFPAQPP